MADTVRAYYDGAAFVPMEPCDIIKGTVVRLYIEDKSVSDIETARKLAAFERITDNLRELDNVEPLPREFEEIMSERVNFSQEINL
jgi:hypothetical protein